RAALSALFGFDVGRADNSAPLVGFVRDEFCEVIGCTANHAATQIREARLQAGVCEGCVDFPIQLADDLDGSALGRAKADPVTCLEARHKFTYGRYFWQCIRARRASRCQRA